MEKYEPFKKENNPFDDKELLVINKTDKNQVSYKFSFLNKNSLLVGIFIFFTISSILQLITFLSKNDTDLVATYINDQEVLENTSTPATTLPETAFVPSKKAEVQPSVPTILEPAVVTPQEPENTFFEIDSGEVFKKTVQIIAEDCFIYDLSDPYTTSLGSGVLISESGYIITNAHVLEDCEGDLLVATINNVDDVTKIKYKATLIEYDLELDLALIKVTQEADGGFIQDNFDYFNLSPSTDIKLGENVEIYGFPTARGNGETYELNINLTKGTVSGFEQYAGLKRGYLVTDADISYGNSGGSAVDSNGYLIGIPTLGKTEGASWIGYLISVDVVLEWLESINYFQEDDISIPQLKIEEIDINSIPKYNRDEWNSWIDEDFDCQNTRHEVLQLESLVNVIFTNGDNCYVQSGKWFDPYNGEYFYFASDLEIDHFIPLYNVHISGGWKWSSERKTIFANNLDKPDILIAIKKSTNRSKSAQTPDSWKPENQSYWCEYALDWIRIKYQWNLSATQNEWDALLKMIETCPSEINYQTATNYNDKFSDEKITIYERND